MIKYILLLLPFLAMAQPIHDAELISTATAQSGVVMDWQLASEYKADAIVEKDGKLYKSNAVIPSNTAFVEGTTGQTWTEISAGSVAYDYYKTIFVDGNGLDTNDGSSINAPLLTLQEADTKASEGDVIQIFRGDYSALNITKRNTAWVGMQGGGSASHPTISGGITSTVDGVKLQNIRIDGASNLVNNGSIGNHYNNVIFTEILNINGTQFHEAHQSKFQTIIIGEDQGSRYFYGCQIEGNLIMQGGANFLNNTEVTVSIQAQNGGFFFANDSSGTLLIGAGVVYQINGHDGMITIDPGAIRYEDYLVSQGQNAEITEELVKTTFEQLRINGLENFNSATEVLVPTADGTIKKMPITALRGQTLPTYLCVLGTKPNFVNGNFSNGLTGWTLGGGHVTALTLENDLMTGGAVQLDGWVAPPSFIPQSIAQSVGTYAVGQSVDFQFAYIARPTYAAAKVKAQLLAGTTVVAESAEFQTTSIAQLAQGTLVADGTGVNGDPLWFRIITTSARTARIDNVILGNIVESTDVELKYKITLDGTAYENQADPNDIKTYDELIALGAAVCPIGEGGGGGTALPTLYIDDIANAPASGEDGQTLLVTSDGTSAGTVTELYEWDGTQWKNIPLGSPSAGVLTGQDNNTNVVNNTPATNNHRFTINVPTDGKLIAHGSVNMFLNSIQLGGIQYRVEVNGIDLGTFAARNNHVTNAWTQINFDVTTDVLAGNVNIDIIPQGVYSGIQEPRLQWEFIAEGTIPETITPSYGVGDTKTSFAASDNNGWILADGRAVSTLTATQQANAAILGFGANIPTLSNPFGNVFIYLGN